MPALADQTHRFQDLITNGTGVVFYGEPLKICSQLIHFYDQGHIFTKLSKEICTFVSVMTMGLTLPLTWQLLNISQA